MSVAEVGDIKHRLVGWKEVVVLADSVLAWEKEYYAALVSGSVTVLFLLLWYMDPSTLTLLSLIGLLVTVLDYGVPRLQAKFFPDSAWNKDNEKKLDQICQELVFVKNGFLRLYDLAISYKSSHPLMYMTTSVVALFLLAQIGAMFSGIFLCYVNLMVIVMLPGLYRRGILDKYCSALMIRLEEFVKAKKHE
jgi:RsiW-degrading membrane proteinase PrsW (M82 family)